MKNNYYSIYPCINIYERPSINSKISSQIIYGEKFKVFKKVKNFLKIKTFYDRYHGYVKNKKFINKIKPTHKVKVLKTKIYKKVGPRRNNRFHGTFCLPIYICNLNMI